MKKLTKYPNIEKFKAKLATQNENLEKQLKEVKKQYPLVAIAYAIQEATIAELSYPMHLLVTDELTIGSIHASLTRSISKELATKLEVEMADCIGDFDNDLKRAQGDVGEETSAVEKFSNCYRNVGKQ